MKPEPDSTAIIIVCKKVEFYSATDERNFFLWAKRLKCIGKIKGVRDEIWLHVKSQRVSDACLRELIALLFRYKIDMAQLKQFLSPTNAHWFTDKEYWFHKLIFLTRPKMKQKG